MTKLHTALRLVLKKPNKIIRAAAANGLLNFVPDEFYLKIVFKSETGYKLNLKKPLTYNEKLQWIKLFDRKPEYTIYVDKCAVREYIRKTIGEEHLIPLLGVYDSVDDIDWGELPDRFVLKCTHGSGCNIICRDKSTLDIREAKRRLRQWMKKSWYWFGREWSYKDIKPRIICEKFLEAEDGIAMVDYKFMCFNGEPKLIQVHRNRYEPSYSLDYYDPSWEKADICRIDAHNALSKAPIPKNFDLMMRISRIISRDMLYARIDLYEHNSRVYFGEITLYPTSGFSTFAQYEDDLKLGSWITLPLPENRGKK